MRMHLTDTAIKRLDDTPKLYRDDLVVGLGLRVRESGTKTFVLTYFVDGRERRLTIGAFPAWTVGAARAEAIEIKNRVELGEDPLADRAAERAEPTVADLADRFVAEYLPRKRPSTRVSYLAHIDQEIRPALGRMKVAEISFADVDRLHRKLTDRGVPYRANRTIATLSRMMTLSIRWRMRSDNPCKGVERNDEVKRRRYLSADALARLTEALAEDPDRQACDAIRMLLLTGARSGEVLAMKWAELDLEAGSWNKLATGTKQRTDHFVPLSEAAVRLLKELRAVAREGQGFVFPARSGDGHRLELQAAWVRLCGRAGIIGARIHDLRHTYASVLASAGLSLPVIGALLGHSTPTTTARYAHLLDDPLRAATERASEIIRGEPKAEVVTLRRGKQ